ncbi:MAG TPA: hypothetical protein VEC37_18430, partial [Bacillota bacterium]|nr:hypothetical protein [Bacillota bacterium]
MNKKGLRNVFLVLIMLLVSIQILGCGGSGSKTASSYNVTAGAYIIELSSGKPATQPNAANEYKNFYGISWRGKASDNLRYAQNMSYKYVFYQQGAENYPDLSQFQFFFDGPLAVAMVGMSGLSTWGIIPSQTGTYSSTTNAFLKANAVWKNTNANNYPYNLASGCIFTQDRYMVNFDLQQDAVRKKVVDYCIQRVKNIQAKCPSIQFKGFAFDAPEI